MMGVNISVKAESKVWYVDDGNVSGPWNGTKEYPYQNITNALEHAVDGDTVFVYNGTYCENIDVDKSVSLVGEDRDSTIVEGNGTGSVISIMADNVNIQSFTIKGSGMLLSNSGIFAHMFSGNEISHNKITNNNDGIHFELSSDNVISDNIISSNNNGIFLGMSGDMISGNTITNNNNGIYLFWSRSNVISSNIISSNNNGIYLHSSWSNVISSNIISSNNNGIILGSDSGNNIIYHNNFDNTHQVEIESSNLWDYNNEGNYWSDYNGTDDNQDGIGETPYIIDDNNRDNYPLTGMFSDLSFTFDGETYHANVISNSTISDFRFEIGQETGNKIIRFYTAGEDGTVGFCRVAIPIELMNYSYIVLDSVEEIVPTELDVSSETFAYLYFTYIQNSHTISIIHSKTMHLYYEMLDKYYGLLDKYIKLETDLYDMNATYQELLNNYTVFLGNYNVFLTDYSELQKSYQELNNSYQELNNSYQELNNSYQELLLDYSKKVNNIQNLMYIFAATTAIFIITTIYLSRSAHTSKVKVSEEARKKRAP
jgi:nitrous oxidase accessory protein